MALIIKTFDVGHVVFMPPIKNIIMKGTFCRMLYATHFFTTNGCYLDTMDVGGVEKDILAAYGSDKSPHYYFKNGRQCSVKISVVWESAVEYGLVYKIIHPF